MLRRVATRVLERAAGPQPEDHALRWRGTADAGRPVVRVAHFGDCSWREMPLAHGIHTRPGFPRALGEELDRHDVGLEFSSWVVHELQWLPGPEQLEAHLRLSGDPDFVLVQLGAIYSRLVVIPDKPLILRLRARIGRGLGRAVFAAYRPLRPLVAGFGRFTVPYPGTGRLVPFLEGVHERWPGARVVVLLPFPRSKGARRQHEMQERVREDVRAAALAVGVDVLDVADDLGRDRCANGYNLGQESSDRVGRRLAEEVLRQPAPA